VMEKKHMDLERKHKDAAEDVEKWKHMATGLQTRLNEVLEAKKVVETSVKELQTSLTSATYTKEAVELEWDSLKGKNVELEDEVKKCKGELVEYFDDGFEHARVQALHFYLEGDFIGFDS